MLINDKWVLIVSNQTMGYKGLAVPDQVYTIIRNQYLMKS